MDEQTTSLAGRELGGYRLLHQLGASGGGVVYLTQRQTLLVASGTQANSSPPPGYTPADYDSAPSASNYTVGVAAGTSWADALASRRSQLFVTWGAVIAIFVAFLALAGIALKWKDPH